MPNTQGPGGGGQDYNGNPIGGGMGVQYSSGGQPRMGFGFDPTTDMPYGQPPVGIQGNQPAPNTLPAPMPGMGGGKGGFNPQSITTPFFGGTQSGGQPQMDFGMPPPGGFNSPFRTQLPQQAEMTPQPTNRFVPPNAPGVRMQPNRFVNTRNRLR